MKSGVAMVAILLSLSGCGLGIVIGLRISAARPAAPDAHSPIAPPSPPPAQQPANPPANQQDFDCVYLPPDHPLRAKLSGKRLPLNYVDLQKGEEKRLLNEAKVKPLSDGRLLVGLGATLYMLDAGFHIQWQYTPTWIIWDFTAVEATGLVYGTAGDCVFFILDATTGKKVGGEVYNGKSSFQEAVSYGKDMCLVTHNMSAYRESLEDWEKPDSLDKDSLLAYRGTKELWVKDWPPDAEPVISGNHIYAVTKTDKSIYVRKVRIPRFKKR